MGVTKSLTTQSDYLLKSRTITGTRAERLQQLDQAIQELLDIKALECAADRPNVHFIAAPRPRPHGRVMVAAIIGLLALLAWMLGVSPAHAQTQSCTASTIRAAPKTVSLPTAHGATV